MSRKQEILAAAALLGAQYGAENVTRVMVANAVKPSVSAVLVGRYIGSKDERVANIKAAMRKIKLKQPDKKAIAEAGAKLRAHGPRVAKVEVPKAKKSPARTGAKRAGAATTKREPAAPQNKALPAPPTNKRVPRTPPVLPAAPLEA